LSNGKTDKITVKKRNTSSQCIPNTNRERETHKFSSHYKYTSSIWKGEGKSKKKRSEWASV